MKRVFSKILALLLVFVLGIEAIMPTMSYADTALASKLDENMDEDTKVEKDLKTLGILIGGTGVDRNSNVSRHEMITLITRILGKEQEAKNGAFSHPFTDVAKWANPYVAFAYSKEITKGTSATTFSGYNNVDANQVITLLLRALKYEDGKDFNWKEAYSFAIEKGILTKDMNINQENFTRNDLNKIVKAFLEACFKDQKVTLIQSLIKDGVITEKQLKELLIVSYKTEELKDEKLPEAKPTSGGGGGGGAGGGGGSTPSAPVVTLDSITAVKTITTYKQDEEVKLDDLVVSANYSDKTTKVVTTYTTNLSELDLTTIGEKTLVITYKENNKEVKTEVKLIIARRLIDLDEYKIDGITYKVNRENNTAEVIDVDDSVINAVILSTLDTYVKDGIEYEIKNHYTVTSIYGELFQNEEGKYTDVKGYGWNLNSVYDYSEERINSLHYDTIVKKRFDLKTNSGAFANKKNLKTVDIPNTIVHIGDGAFINCTSLESVVLPNKLEVINAATFYNCNQVEYFYIPKTLQFIHPLFDLDKNNSIRIVYEGSIDDMKKMICSNNLYLNKKVEFENGNVKIVAENLYVSKTKTTYEYGEKINLDDLLVTVEYNNKTKKEITNYTTNIEDIDTKVSGEKTLVVIYKEDNKEVKAEIKIFVNENKEEIIKKEVQTILKTQKEFIGTISSLCETNYYTDEEIEKMSLVLPEEEINTLKDEKVINLTDAYRIHKNAIINLDGKACTINKSLYGSVDDDNNITSIIKNFNITFKNSIYVSNVIFDGEDYKCQIVIGDSVDTRNTVLEKNYFNNVIVRNITQSIYNSPIIVYSNFDITDSIFENNYGTTGVIAISRYAYLSESIYLNSNILNINGNCIFKNNKGQETGALYINGISNVNINDNTIFEDNISYKNGGAITMSQECSYYYWRSSYGSIAYYKYFAGKLNIKDNCKFINNKCTNNGGAICLKLDELGNSYTSSGPSYYNNGIISISGTLFENNSAKNEGGAIYGCEHNTITITNCDFCSNEANNYGAIYGADVCSITNSIFDSNVATEKGGALGYISSLNKCEMYNNIAQKGGAIYDNEIKLIGKVIIPYENKNEIVGIIKLDNQFDSSSMKEKEYKFGIYSNKEYIAVYSNDRSLDFDDNDIYIILTEDMNVQGNEVEIYVDKSNTYVYKKGN